MKGMDTGHIKQILGWNLLHTVYNNIYVVDLETHCCGEWAVENSVLLNLQNYDNWLISLAEKMYKTDTAAFFVQMNLNRICASITKNIPRCIVYYRLQENDYVQEFRLIICYADESRTHLLFFQEALLKDVPKPLGTIDEMNHCNARFKFLANYVVVDFIEINVGTGACHMFTADDRMEAYSDFKKQLTWWAENIIVPEEREAYINEYELENLVRHLRANNGCHTATYTTFSGSERNSIMIRSTLIKENNGGIQEYIFAYAQDITQLKAQEIRNKQLVDISQQLLTLSQTEPVTGLYNRAACEKLVEEHLSTTRKDVPGTMLLIDIDHFKGFNDYYGHPTGDFVLKFLGNTMKDIFRSDDLVSRWGGDEFVVFMRDVCDKRTVIGRIERLRAKLRQCKKDGKSLPITISIGGKVAVRGMTMEMLFDDCIEHSIMSSRRGAMGSQLVLSDFFV